MVKISIIVPVYNTAKYLDKCIQTLINQTLENIEIIFIDDGSEDNSVEILKNYAKKDKRIRILKQNHKRQGAARNYGLSIAQGEYIGFVDSDDWVKLDMFEKLYYQAKEADSDIVMCSMNTFEDGTNKIIVNTYNTLDIFNQKFFENSFTPQDTLNFIFNISVSPYNKIYRKSLIDKNNIKFPENIYFEDNAFFFQSWLNAKKISLLNQKLYQYRKSTASTTKNDKNKLDIFKTLDLTKNILEENNYYNRLKTDYLRYKSASLQYWFGSIQNKRIKFLFFIKLLMEMPTVALLPIFIKFKELKLLLILLFDKKNKIILWGASNFLANFLKKHKIHNTNILCIVDRNENKNGSELNGLTIYSPNKVKELSPDRIIVSIINFSIESKRYIEQYLKENNIKDCKLELL